MEIKIVFLKLMERHFLQKVHNRTFSEIGYFQ